ncbi:hypothetical protein P7C70_g681, partial [Phenoliferia sp. Uapishka_3]
MYPQPSRVLGDGNTGAAVADLPYGNTSNAEVTSFDDPPPSTSLRIDTSPTERTSLLPSSAPRVRPKLSPRLGRDGSDDPPSFRGPVPARRRPISLRLSFAFACILVYVNLSFLVLTLASFKSPFMAANSLPPHYGSLFLPIWLTVLSLATNSLSLLAFVVPTESPRLTSWTAVCSTFALLIQLILVLAVGQLRHQENILTLVLLGVAIISTIHAAVSARLVIEYTPLLVSPAAPPPETGFFQSLKRVFVGLFAFLSVSLPIVVLQIAIFVAFVLLTINVILRAYDASLAPQGHIYKVNPWRRPTGGSTGVSDINGRPYNLHLACRGAELDPILALGANGEGNVTAGVLKNPTFVRRTILVENEQGVPGSVGAEWVMQMLREGTLTSSDTDIRVCFYDRPGYGFSDNSPTSAIPHVVKALSHALALSGEIARIETSPRIDSSVIPSPLARSGFVLLGTGAGALHTSLFASTYPRLVHSVLYLKPIPPSLHYSSHGHSLLHAFRFFFVDALGSWSTELGLVRIWSTLRGSSRAKRVLSTERTALRSEIMRSYLQEEAETHKPGGKSARAWENARSRYPERPTIVLSPEKTKGNYGYTSAEWSDGQETFVDNVVGRGLEKWETGWSGECGTESGDLCRESLLKLVRLD